MKMSKLERLFLSNQLLILEKLYPEEAGYYAKTRKAVEWGYALHYSELSQNIFDEMSESECRWVFDVLEMYRAITFSEKKVSIADTSVTSHLKFEGFDGNNETSQMTYVEYLVNDLGRYQELKYDDIESDFNSHSPMADIYERMLARWRTCPDKFELSADEIQEIIRAGRPYLK